VLRVRRVEHPRERGGVFARWWRLVERWSFVEWWRLVERQSFVERRSFDERSSRRRLAAASCTYTDDASFCACVGWDCGGATMTNLKDSAGKYIVVYCGSCSSKPDTWCQPTIAGYAGAGTCGGNNPLVYPYQRGLINMLEAMGENDTTDYQSEYTYIQNVKAGRGYTIGTVGFCRGTGDFVVVARCLNDLEHQRPGEVLARVREDQRRVLLGEHEHRRCLLLPQSPGRCRARLPRSGKTIKTSARSLPSRDG